MESKRKKKWKEQNQKQISSQIMRIIKQFIAPMPPTHCVIFKATQPLARGSILHSNSYYKMLTLRINNRSQRHPEQMYVINKFIWIVFLKHLNSLQIDRTRILKAMSMVWWHKFNYINLEEPNMSHQIKSNRNMKEMTK